MKLTERGRRQYDSGREQGFFTEAPPLPANLMVELTNACNHACIFCANPHMTRRIGRIRPGLLDRVMQEARAGGVREIGFYTTGDPFVHKDLERFTARARELGFSYIYISTNGALATPERARRAIDAGMNSIKFSINAGSRDSYRLIHGKDEWDKVLSHLRFIAEYRKTLDRPLSLYVTYVVTNQNRHEVEDFKALVGPLVDEVSFNECGIQSGQMNAAQALLGTVDHGARGDGGLCPLPFNRLHVTCEGYLTLCCVDYQNYLAVADLQRTSLAEAWHSEPFRKARRLHLEERLEGTLCGNCWLGRMDAIAPLDAALASPVSFDAFYKSTAERTRERLADGPSQPVRRARRTTASGGR